MEKIENLEDLIYFLRSKRWNSDVANDLNKFYEYLDKRYSSRKDWNNENIEKVFIQYLQGRYGIRKDKDKTQEEKDREEKVFKEYLVIAEGAVTANKKKSENKTLVIVGGQSGAGKSRLITLSKKEFYNNVVIVDFDELRELHPNHEIVNELYPEWTHRILHPDTEEVKNRLLDSVMRDGYNVVYEGALRNTQGFIDFARKFQECGYNIKMKIMSVPKLESYGSTFFRYAVDLLSDESPRWVEKNAHDGSYDGVIRTTQEFINKNLTSDVSVYVRGAGEPKKIYSTQERQYPDAITAIKEGRELGRQKAVTDFTAKYNVVKSTFSSKKPELIESLTDWKNLYEDEKQFFENKNMQK